VIGIYGHGSARDQICCLRLVEELGDDFKFYNGGTNPALARASWSVPAQQMSPHDLAQACKADGISLMFVTDALVLQTDTADVLAEEGIQVLAPSSHAALLEGRKSLMKKLMVEAGVPTPDAWIASSADQAKALLRENWRDGHRYVVKTDPLITDAIHRAMVPETLIESLQDVDEEMEALHLAHAPEQVLIEQRIDGFETSVHVIWDGETYVLMPPVRDYKRVGDGDTGPNTYGAASVACGRGFAPKLDRQLREHIIEPALNHIRNAGYAYRGFVYFGVMLCDDGPVLLEINVRPGNPEFLALLGLLKSDFADLIQHAANGTLAEADIRWYEDSFCGAVFAMGEGYPQTMTPPRALISGLEQALSEGYTVVEDVAATNDGAFVVSGGRVAATVALGSSLEEVRLKALDRLSAIEFKGKHFRSDLGYGIADELFASGQEERC
jgi:phosphoribosylamine---glycine ligase